MEKNLVSLPELQAHAEVFVRSLVPNENHATLISLSGELGAGKTTFTQAISRSLGIQEPVTSPTFVLEKIYELPEGNIFSKLVHIDAYRLESGKELEALGFNELYKDSKNLILIEWFEKVKDTLPSPDARISLSVETDSTRTLTYEK